MTLGTVLKATTLGILIASYGFAMGTARRSGPIEIEVSKSEIFQNFTMKASSGGSSRIASDIWEQIETGPVGGIPPENSRTDYSLCEPYDGDGGDEVLRKTRFLLKVSQIMTRLMSAAKPKKLTNKERKFLRTVPRCEKFRPFLTQIANELNDTMTWRESLRLVKKQPRQIHSIRLKNKNGKGILSILANGKQHEFKLKNKIKFSSDGGAYNLHNLATAKGATGQGIGVRLAISDVDYHGSEPTTYTESCTVSERIRICEDDDFDWSDSDWHESDWEDSSDWSSDRSCKVVTVERKGSRVVEVNSSATTTEYMVALHKDTTPELAHLYFSVYDDSSYESRGDCQ